MIETFRNKGLLELFETGASAKIASSLQKRIIRRLDALEAASDLAQLNQPGFNLHPLHTKPQRYSIHVNGPWCLTFEWETGKARRLDLEQYH
ncbi:MAG TPA: type II toxin-antitoxin system RelE/ParE family toxin [Stellaceae bacterium]|nr:type II toxin-antitoxin system RelE/ParE family toxin [Stellaceae bacterium]